MSEFPPAMPKPRTANAKWANRGPFQIRLRVASQLGQLGLPIGPAQHRNFRSSTRGGAPCAPPLSTHETRQIRAVHLTKLAPPHQLRFSEPHALENQPPEAV